MTYIYVIRQLKVNVASHIACLRHYVVMFLDHKMAGESVFRKRAMAVLGFVLGPKLESKPKHTFLFGTSASRLTPAKQIRCYVSGMRTRGVGDSDPAVF